MDIAGELHANRDVILRLAAQHGARDVRIFGSVARGQAHPTSDVDILITLDDGRSLLDLIAFKHAVEDLLGRPVDVVTPAGVSKYIRDTVLKEAVDL